MAMHMLTTVDNPYDPFEEFDDWYAFDTRTGHHSLALLGRIVASSHALSQADQDLAIELAIDEIARENVSGIHIKVTKDGPSVASVEI